MLTATWHCMCTEKKSLKVSVQPLSGFKISPISAEACEEIPLRSFSKPPEGLVRMFKVLFACVLGTLQRLNMHLKSALLQFLSAVYLLLVSKLLTLHICNREADKFVTSSRSFRSEAFLYVCELICRRFWWRFSFKSTYMYNLNQGSLSIFWTEVLHRSKNAMYIFMLLLLLLSLSLILIQVISPIQQRFLACLVQRISKDFRRKGKKRNTCQDII